MNKKTLALLLSALAGLVILVVIGVVLLFRDDSPRPRHGDLPAPDEATRAEAYAKAAAQSVPLFSAVPSDAALLATFGSFRDGLAAMTDTVHVLPALLDGGARRGFPAFLRRAAAVDLGALRHASSIVSLHYSGDWVPLLLVEAGTVPADTSEAVLRLMAAADSARLSARLVDGSAFPESRLRKSLLLVVSPSEALVTASVRHLESGASILDSRCFPEAASHLNGADGLYFSHAYAEKLFPAYFQRPFARYGSFFGKYAEWTAFQIKELSPRECRMTGISARSKSDPAYVANFLGRTPGGDIRCAEVLPATTLLAVSVSTERLPEYLEAYRRFLDADRKLAAYRKAVTTPTDSVLTTPEKWALQWDIKEVVRASVATPAGLRPLLLLRPGKSVNKFSEPEACPFASYPGLVFGPLFDMPQPASYLVRGGWVLIGGKDVLAEGPVLKTVAEFAPSKGTQLALWYCPTAASASAAEVFRSPLLEAVRDLGKGAAMVPVTLTLKGGEAELVARRMQALPQDAPAALADTSVAVPAGPFPVKNSGTGKTNSFAQAPNGSLQLRDEQGKGLWAIPFSGRLCGRVQTIDYYANGKLQFLFAAGSKLYLIDRLGRFVNPFPVDLGKAVRLGPDVYDFTGAHGYTAMVLHTDNTIGMYDLHGRHPKDWKGIAPQEPVKALPELLKVGEKRYWAVRTSVQTLIYGFWGGEPLGKATGDRRIAPDSGFTVKGGDLQATCLDGRQRSVKL